MNSNDHSLNHSIVEANNETHCIYDVEDTKKHKKKELFDIKNLAHNILNRDEVKTSHTARLYLNSVEKSTRSKAVDEHRPVTGLTYINILSQRYLKDFKPIITKDNTVHKRRRRMRIDK